jgi:FMN hydrolase / 5-amino-6-(5-phospho-D-ribitylamino)uracil phosphatase
MLNPSKIRAITLDLDDTLWPIGPTLERAEAVLQSWLDAEAPATAEFWRDIERRRALRAEVNREHAALAHDLTHLRHEMIALALRRAGDDPALASPAFEVFFAARQRVDCYADALPALELLAARYPLLTLSNGNADVHLAGLGRHFTAQVSARVAGVAKPDPRIFAHAAAAAGVAAHEVLHIGDDAALDVIGALESGMQAVWINRDGHSWQHGAARPHLEAADLLAVCAALGLSGPQDS